MFDYMRVYMSVCECECVCVGVSVMVYIFVCLCDVVWVCESVCK